MKLKVRSTSELGSGGNWSILLYGDNRSGKTYFAGTWPRPLFLVPEIVGQNEMRTLAEWDFPFITFGKTSEFQSICEEVIRAVKKREKIGNYVPRTLVVDNLTTAQMMWEEDVKAQTGKDKLEWSDWGGIKTLTQRAITELARVDLHQIWITHAKVWRRQQQKDGPRGKVEQYVEEGGWTLNGASREVLPNHCDLLLYAEAIDRGGAKPTGYVIHGRKKGIWPAGARLTRCHQDKPFTRLGPEPSPEYDDLAPYLGLPSLADEEKEG